MVNGRPTPDGPEHYDVVRDKSIAMFSEAHAHPGDLGLISAPTLVLVGDGDMIELSHTVSLYEGLPAARITTVARGRARRLVDRRDDLPATKATTGRLVTGWSSTPAFTTED